jgi:NADPH:quinone reductase
MKGISFANQLTSVVGTTSVGLVDAVGPDVGDLKSGDSVFISYPGTWTDSMTIPVENVCKIPSLAAEEAALIPSVASAWAILTSFIPLKSGDTVISLGSSNPIGLAIAEVGKALGINVVNAVAADATSKEFKAKLKGKLIVDGFTAVIQ